MTTVMRIVGLADGRPTPHAGRFLKSSHPDERDGRGLLVTTHDPSKAMRFASPVEALAEWKRQSTVRPERTDGKPNRPLTAYTVEVMPFKPDPIELMELWWHPAGTVAHAYSVDIDARRVVFPRMVYAPALARCGREESHFDPSLATRAPESVCSACLRAVQGGRDLPPHFTRVRDTWRFTLGGTLFAAWRNEAGFAGRDWELHRLEGEAWVTVADHLESRGQCVDAALNAEAVTAS